MLSQNFIIALLSSLACASAIPKTSKIFSREAQAADMIAAIAPTSNTCSGATAPTECETNTQAAPFLISAMAQYSITNPNEIAGILALIAFESGDFKYNTNHFPAPGRPGQGTRNMQMANFNLMYAKSIPALSTKLSAITTASSTTGLSDDELNAIRALVLPDEYAWGSAAWFLTTQCASARPALQAGGDAGFNAYMQCVTGAAATSDRLAYWTRATKALSPTNDWDEENSQLEYKQWRERLVGGWSRIEEWRMLVYYGIIETSPGIFAFREDILNGFKMQLDWDAAAGNGVTWFYFSDQPQPFREIDDDSPSDDHLQRSCASSLLLSTDNDPIPECMKSVPLFLHRARSKRLHVVKGHWTIPQNQTLMNAFFGAIRFFGQQPHFHKINIQKLSLEPKVNRFMKLPVELQLILWMPFPYIKRTPSYGRITRISRNAGSGLFLGKS
ncbi:hypothetical protein LSUE1_G003786 [Lachnellula suecica]|uniref:Uncharacterized protein n=1 Tax=Lachnellula suecica TaxID=602035 RepID=A0A8T9C7S4_9HELO|nr:hypothetical protein LSUE1_G003786 [Lachnellula suecica]